MKALVALLWILYLTPPAGLLLYGAVNGSINSWGDALVASLRVLVVAIAAVAVGLGLAERVRFLQHDGAQFYARFYVLYLILFFVFGFFLGLENQFPDQHRAGRYTY